MESDVSPSLCICMFRCCSLTNPIHSRDLCIRSQDRAAKVKRYELDGVESGALFCSVVCEEINPVPPLSSRSKRDGSVLGSGDCDLQEGWQQALREKACHRVECYLNSVSTDVIYKVP